MNASRRAVALRVPGALSLAAAGLAPPAWGQADGPLRWPALSLLDGTPWTPPVAADGRPHAVIAVIWSTTCPFCLRHNARLEQLRRRAAGRPLSVVTAALDVDGGGVPGYLARHGYGFAVVREADRLRALFTTRRVIPFTATVDRDGRIRERIPGEMSEDDLLALLQLAV